MPRSKKNLIFFFKREYPGRVRQIFFRKKKSQTNPKNIKKKKGKAQTKHVNMVYGGKGNGIQGKDN